LFIFSEKTFASKFFALRVVISFFFFVQWWEKRERMEMAEMIRSKNAFY